MFNEKGWVKDGFCCSSKRAGTEKVNMQERKSIRGGNGAEDGRQARRHSDR